MANEFDNTDPLQLSNTPQAAVPEPVQPQGAVPDPVQPQQPVQPQPTQRELTNEDRINFYRGKGYSDSQIVGIMQASGKATREQTQGIMLAQYENQRREILEYNERLKKEQADAEKHMIERQQALDALLKKKDSASDPSTLPGGAEVRADLELPAAQPRDVDSEVNELVQQEGFESLRYENSRPEDYDTPELLNMYQANGQLADLAVNMSASNAAIKALKSGDNQELREAVEAADNEAIQELFQNYITADPRSSDYGELKQKLSQGLFDLYDESNRQSSLAMQRLQSINEELGLPWNYNNDSEIDRAQAMLESMNIREDGERTTQRYQDMLFSQRMARARYDELEGMLPDWLVARSVAAGNFANSMISVMPNQIAGLAFDQIGDRDKANEYFEKARIVSDYNQQLTKERNKRSYEFTDEELNTGLWESIVGAWNGEDDKGWGLVARKAAATFEDVFPDVAFAVVTMGEGTAMKQLAKEGLKEATEEGVKRQLKRKVLFGNGISASTAATFGVRSMGDTYDSVFDDPTRTLNEKMFLATSVGVAEATMQFIFKGAEASLARGGTALRNFASGAAEKNWKQAMKDALKGVTKRQIAFGGAKQTAGEFFEEAIIEAVDQSVRVVQDKMAGRKTKGIDGNAIMDAGLAGLLGTGPMTTLQASSAMMANHKVKKTRSYVVEQLKKIDRDMMLTEDPAILGGMKDKRRELEGYLNQLEGMSEAEYHKLTDNEKKQINALHRELAVTRDQIKREKNPDTKRRLEERFEGLYKRKVDIEKAAESRASMPPAPPLSDAEGNDVASNERDVDPATQKEHANMPEEQDREAPEITEAIDKKVDGHVASHRRAVERVASDPENSARHARTAKSMRTKAKKLLMAEGMTQAEAEAEVDRRIGTAQADTETKGDRPARSVNLNMVGDTDVNADWIGDGPGQIPLPVVAQMDRMKRAFGKLLDSMGVQIQIHLDAESFSDATGTGKNTRGAYDPSTKTIHLNPNSSVKDVIEEFGHAAFRSILKSDSKFAKKVYENILSEAGMGTGAFGRIDRKTGMLVLPKNFREDANLQQLAKDNPFALAVLKTEDLYPDYDPARRREETILEALREYATNPSKFNAASRRGRGRTRLEQLKAIVNRAMTKAGFRGNFISPDGGADFYSFANKFKLATEGVETDVTMDESDYTAQTNIENSTERKNQRKKKKKRVIRAREGETNEEALLRDRREQEIKRQRENNQAVADFERELGAPPESFESREGSVFNYLKDTEVFYESVPPLSGGLVNKLPRKKSLKVKDYYHFRNWYNYMTRNQTDNNIRRMYYVKDGVKKMINPPKPSIDKETGEPKYIAGPETWVQRQVRLNTEALERRAQARKQQLRSPDDVEPGQSLGDGIVQIEGEFRRKGEEGMSRSQLSAADLFIMEEMEKSRGQRMTVAEFREEQRRAQDRGLTKKRPLESREGSVFSAANQLQAHNENRGSTFTFDGVNQVGRPMSAVSIFPERSRIITGQLTEDQINTYVQDNKDFTSGNEDVLAIGTWYEAPENQTYLDISAVLPHEQANQLGRDYNQKAVFNLETLQEVDTGGTGEAVQGLKPESERVADLRRMAGEKLEARAGGVFDTLDMAEAKRKGLPTDNIESISGAQIRFFGFDRTMPTVIEDLNHRIASGIQYIFNKRVPYKEGDARLITAHRNMEMAKQEYNGLKKLAMADSKSSNPLGYIAIGFTLNGEASTTGNPDVFSYLIKKFRQNFDGDQLISKTNTAVNSITKKYKAPMINRIQEKAIQEGRNDVSSAIDIEFNDKGQPVTASANITTAEQAAFVLDMLEDASSPFTFQERNFSSGRFTQRITPMKEVMDKVVDPLFKNADLGTAVAFVKVPYRIENGDVKGFDIVEVPGDPFAGAIVVEPGFDNQFEGHRLTERQYRLEDIMPDYSLAMGTREVTDPETGEKTRVPARRRRLSSAVAAATRDAEGPMKDFEAKVREKVSNQAAKNVFKGVVNINYGDVGAMEQDIFLTSRGAIQRPSATIDIALGAMESREGSVFESRAEDAPTPGRPEGQFQQRDLTRFGRFKAKWIRRLQDKYSDIMGLQEDVETFLGRAVREDEDFKMAEELMYGKTASDLKKLDQKIDKLTSNMKANGVRVGELTDYLYALHAKERNDVILERDGVENGSGMSNAEASAILDGISEGKRAALDSALKIVREIQQDTRNTMVEFGLETAETVDAWESLFENYVPLSGIATDEFSSDKTTYPTGGAGMQVRGPMTKRAEGRKSKADNLVAQIIAQNSAVKIQARKNEALGALHTLITNNPNPAIWEIVDDAKFGDNSVVPVRINGKQEFIKFVEPQHAETLKNMSIPKTNWLAKVLRPVNNWLRRSFTTLNPEFVISNFSRDIQSALFNAAAESDIEGGQVLGKKVMGDMARMVGPSMKALFKETNPKSLGKIFEANPIVGKYYQDFVEDGGQTGWGYQKDLQQIAADLEKSTTDKSRAQEILGAVKENTVDVVEGVNDAFENAIRLSSYIAARENGVSRAKAAQFAKNITVNFNKHGEYGQVANQIFLFFNASVQGTARLGRSLVTLKSPKAPDGSSREWYQRINTAQKMAAGLTVFSAMLAQVGRALSDEDEDGTLYWDKIPDYVKERNMIIMVDGKNYIKVPLPYGYNMFANLGTGMVDYAAGAKTWDETGWFLANSFISSFSPVSFGQSEDLFTYGTKAFVPTAFKPVFEAVVNETYYGGPVYAEQLPFGAAKPNSHMSFKSPKQVQDFFEWMNKATGGSAQFPGDVDINPDKFWHIFDYFLGGAGQFVRRTSAITRDAVIKATNDELEVEFNDIPLLRKMYGEPSKYYDMEKFMDRQVEITQLMREARDPKARRSGEGRYKGVGTLDKALKVASKRLKAIRKAKRNAKDIKDYAERQIRIQELMDLERKVVMKFNKLYDNVRKEN